MQPNPPPAPSADPLPPANWYARLSQRARVLLVGGTLAVVLVALAASVPVPYVALGPGVTYNTLGAADGTAVITFSGQDIPAAAAEQSPAVSHLNMTTISVTDRVPLFAALGLWATGDNGLVPREDQFPPDKTVEQVNQENAAYFRESQSNAEIAALRYLKYPEVVFVGDIPQTFTSQDGKTTVTSPAYGVLDPNDEIVAIDSTPVTDRASLLAALKDTKPGQRVQVGVLRDGKKQSVPLTLAQRPDTQPQGFLGTQPTERPQAPFTITISLEGIGGPSAGLMFTLGIIDKLTAGDLTGGHFIAGTGTINPGTDPSQPSAVGPIGGITYKLIAARAAGATTFLVPADNCAEALTDVPEGLYLAKVSTLDEAMTAVRDVAAGRTPPGC